MLLRAKRSLIVGMALVLWEMHATKTALNHLLLADLGRFRFVFQLLAKLSKQPIRPGPEDEKGDESGHCISFLLSWGFNGSV